VVAAGNLSRGGRFARISRQRSRNCRSEGPGKVASIGDDEGDQMPTTLKTAITRYLRGNNRAKTTRSEYHTTLKKWTEWGNGLPIEELGRKEVREFLDWVYDRALSQEGTNPGRTSNKARDHLRAIISWAWEQDLIDSFPRFPKPKPQRDVAGRHYLTKTELNALYFATHKMKRPKGWTEPFAIGRYWRAAIVVFFNYGVDTGTGFDRRAQGRWPNCTRGCRTLHASPFPTISPTQPLPAARSGQSRA
jgi:hypothetical protein